MSNHQYSECDKCGERFSAPYTSAYLVETEVDGKIQHRCIGKCTRNLVRDFTPAEQYQKARQAVRRIESRIKENGCDLDSPLSREHARLLDEQSYWGKKV